MDYHHPERQQLMNELTLYVGPLGSVVQVGRYFDAWKNGFWTGRFNTLDEAMEMLIWRARIATEMSANYPG